MLTDEEIPGIRKAAILLLSMDPDIAAQVLQRLDKTEVEEVSREIAATDRIENKSRNSVIQEFYSLALASSYMDEGGMEYARRLLSKSLSKEDADEICGQVERTINASPFAFLAKAEAANLLTFIQDEHPQTIALILAHLAPAKASEILVGLPARKQIEVVKRIANMEQTNPEVIKEVEQGLEHRLAAMIHQTLEKAGGVEAVAEMLNLADRATEKGILDALEADDPDLVESIRRLMFVFEDILRVDDRGIQAVLKEIDNSDLALALRTASDEFKGKIFKNMPERASQLIREDMEHMGPVRVSDVEAAQQKIVDAVRRLEESGEIAIAGRGGEKDVVV